MDENAIIQFQKTDNLLDDAQTIIESARQNAYQAVKPLSHLSQKSHYYINNSIFFTVFLFLYFNFLLYYKMQKLL